MNIKELRIDNWILYGKKMRVQVCSVKGNGWVETYITADGDISHYSGIPLTPEILDKAGFGHEGDGVYCDRWIMQIKLNKGIYTAHLFEEVGGETWYIKDIYYVHQLQNLYYEVTGTELKIEL